MTIVRIDVRHQKTAQREGLLLCLEDRHGHVGLGEASPLPGYSPDDLEGCRAALGALDPAAIGELSADGSALTRELALLSAILPARLPAARHALETALLDLLAQRRGEPIWALLARAAGPRALPSLVPLAALVDGDDRDALTASAERAVRRGIRTLKLKLGRHGFAEEIERVATLRRLVGPAIELRLDVNRRWNADDAGAHLADLAGLRPELVEESVPLSRLHELCGSPVPLALDESLQDAGALEGIGVIAPACRLVALVLKPMALGGFSRCLELARWARDRDLDVIVSHVFDGPVALAAAAHLALAIGSPGRAAGLAPHRGLAAWPRVELPLVKPAHVIADDAPGLGLDLGALAA